PEEGLVRHKHVVPWRRDPASAQRRKAPRLVRRARRRDRPRFGADARDGGPRRRRAGRAAAGMARGGASPHGRLRDRPDLSLALYFWLRPFGHAVAQTVGERRVARQLVDAYGSDSLSFFALRRDKSYLFSPSGRAFLAYRVVAGTTLVSGDPVGDETEIDDLLAELRRIARAHGWRFAVVGASDDHLQRYRALGLKPVSIGEEAVLSPQGFSLEGRAIRKVRQSVSRLRKAGYSFRIVAADEAARALEAELADLSAAWRRGEPERGLPMAIDDLHIPGTMLALAEDAEGRLGGFLHLAPSLMAGGGGGWSLSA